MTLSLYNTLTRRKEPFAPIDPKNVRLYVCGPTVYDYAHIGNARPVVVFDVLYRLLRHLYGADHVKYARNITDVDDKIIAAAKEKGEPIETITERFAQVFREDMAALGALPPDVEPKATDHIGEMIAMIETLIASDHAYEADGHVLFAVATMPEYGALSRHGRDELIAGARVEIAPYKRDPADFILWKPSAPDQPGWDSKWGRGRPGWHLECSAMSEKHLGRTFDIHGGGQDLIFPHHENEIAQSVCAHGKPFVNVWMHNGYLTVDGEKMSKSLGNFHTVHDLLYRVAGETIRLSLLSAHYRQPLDFSLPGLDRAKAALDRFYTALAGARDVEPAEQKASAQPVVEALADDLNTPKALAGMHDLATMLNKAKSREDQARAKAGLLFAGSLIGVFQIKSEIWLKRALHAQSAQVHGTATVTWTPDQIEEMIKERSEARRDRDFDTADDIRQKLADYGVILEDRPDGTTDWRQS